MSDDALRRDIGGCAARIDRMLRHLDGELEAAGAAERPRSADPRTLAVPAVAGVAYAGLRRSLEREFAEESGCDRTDYALAAFSGALAGVVDVLWVGMPGHSEIGKQVDKAADKMVVRLSNLIARPTGHRGHRPLPTDRIDIAISRLEQVFKVNYDQRFARDVAGLARLSPSNHHLKSLAHSPDWVGLLCSILCQFFDVSVFVDDGRLVHVDTETFELHGGNVAAKLFCAVCNWIGHILSDLAGSTSSRMQGPGHRGIGLQPPFFWLTQFVDAGQFGKERKTFAEIAQKVFESGYDLRHFAACAVPVVLNELVVRLSWALRRRFGKRLPPKRCIPRGSNPSVNRMLLVSYATFCSIDAIDAGFRSGGQFYLFLLHVNLPAWYRLAKVSCREVDFLLDKDRHLLELHAKKLEQDNARLMEELGVTQEEVDAVSARFRSM